MALAQGAFFSKASKKITSKLVRKEVVEKSTKEVAEELAEKALSKNISKTYAIKKHAIKKIGPSAEKKISKEVQERIISEAADRTIIKSITATSAKQTGKAIFKPITKNTLRNGALAVEKKELIKTSQGIVKKEFNKEVETAIAHKGGKRLAASISDDIIKSVESSIGKKGAKLWQELLGKEALENQTKILLKDLASNKALKKAIQRNPEILKAYHQLIESAYRTDLTMLRYINFGAGKFGRMMPKIGKKWGFGEDIIIKSEKGVNTIYNSANELLGTISGDAFNGYVVNCSATNRTLLNIFPLKNTTYKCGNNTWKTNAYGQVIYARSIQKGPVGKVIPRDNALQRDVVTLKNNYSVNGDLLNNGHLFPNDEGGHIIALQNGGTNDLINFFPQSPKSNRNMEAFTLKEQAWYNSERSANKALNKGATVEREVYLDFNNTSSMRPDKIRLTQKVNGQIEILKQNKYGGPLRLDNVEILND